MNNLKEKLFNGFFARVIKRYLTAQGGNWSLVVSWNALFAFFPIVIATLTLLGLALNSTGFTADVQTAITHAFAQNPDQIKTINDALSGVKKQTGLLAIVGFVGLLWSGSALFASIEQALDALYPHTQRNFIKQRLMGFGMIFLFTFLTIPLILSSSLLSSLENLSFVPSFLTSGPMALLLQIGFGLLDGILLFGAIYIIVPNRKVRVAGAMPGAFFAAILFEVFSLIFPLYFKLSHGFSTYGQTFALFFLLITYFYFIGQILILGGALNAQWQVEHGEVETLGGHLAGGFKGANDGVVAAELKGEPGEPMEVVLHTSENKVLKGLVKEVEGKPARELERKESSSKKPVETESKNLKIVSKSDSSESKKRAAKILGGITFVSVIISLVNRRKR